MKVLLIFPAIADVGFNHTGQPFKQSWLHHGLCSVSAYAKSKGHDVSLLDLREISGWDEVRERITGLKPEVIGITTMDVDTDYAMEAARIARSCDPNVKIVLGGPYASIMPDEAAKNTCLDHIIIGEGEISFAKLLDDIKAGRPSERVIKGEHPDLDTLPFADRELFPFGEQPLERYMSRPFVTMIAGRGCGHDCSYCQPAERMIFGNRIRRRSVPHVIDEIKTLRDKYDYGTLFFIDDSFTQNVKWVYEFCEEYVKNKFRRPFACMSRADIICKHPDMVRAMRRAGLTMFLIGLESGNQRILDFLRKRTSVEDNVKAAKICKKYGVRVWASYMLGMPTETKEEMMDTVKMIWKIKPYRPSPNFFSPHPGTDIYNFCSKHDLSLIESSADYLRSSNKPKLKGVDYEFVNRAFELSKKRFLSVRLGRKVDFIREQRVKQPLRKFAKQLFAYDRRG
jgi:radical SAM superfamily enzyme YgiQ (UPF0313 family)